MASKRRILQSLYRAHPQTGQTPQPARPPVVVGVLARPVALSVPLLARNRQPALSLAAVSVACIQAAVEACHEVHGRTSVADMVNRSGYSRRRFVDLFKDAVGVSPKTYLRLQRFQGVLARTQGTSVEDWARLAVDCGNCDQAHLIQDFRQFAGVTPVPYNRARPRERNHLAL